MFKICLRVLVSNIVSWPQYVNEGKNSCRLMDVVTIRDEIAFDTNN